jgi:hypothetical protein
MSCSILVHHDLIFCYFLKLLPDILKLCSLRLSAYCEEVYKIYFVCWFLLHDSQLLQNQHYLKVYLNLNLLMLLLHARYALVW